MLCEHCKKLSIIQVNKKCYKCSNYVGMNISNICDICSNINKICSACLKKISNDRKSLSNCKKCGNR